MASNQGLRQASVRAVTSTTWDYNGDWSALFNAASIATGKDWNGRLLDWINLKLGTSYTSVETAKNAFAVSLGVTNWESIGTFTATTSGGTGGGSTFYILGF